MTRICHFFVVLFFARDRWKSAMLSKRISIKAWWMSRSIRFNTLIRRLLALTSFFFGFSFGLLLWPDEDSTACTPAPTPIVSKTFYEHFQYRTENTCRNSKSSLFLTIGVLSSHERLLQYLPSMFDTWFLTADKQIEIILFIEENSTENEQILSRTFSFYKNRTGDHIETCIYIVKLRHVINQYPPQQKSFYAMKYLYGFYQRRTSWILRLDDNTFVNLPSLILWLKSIDSRKPLYIGQGGTGRVNGPPIHFPHGKVKRFERKFPSVHEAVFQFDQVFGVWKRRERSIYPDYSSFSQ